MARGWTCRTCRTHNASTAAECAGCGGRWADGLGRVGSVRTPPFRPSYGAAYRPSPRDPESTESLDELLARLGELRERMPAPAVPDPPLRQEPVPSGCAGCLAFLLIVGLVALLGWAVPQWFDDEESTPSGDETPRSAEEPLPEWSGPCPDRVADGLELAPGATTELVAAYRTEETQILICREESGALHYVDEFIDLREAGTIFPAEETESGFTAENPPNRYEIAGDVLRFFEDGEYTGEREITPEPSPT
ncbi:hypothetical protein [Streptomyces sp. SBT349]|uniref:hypothetical protein n=1 Tax=Streptomyces sp. SBT349 TaxID=1580539 RepID=UPI00066C5530|nr:hypothetical protein [Streptomyces sp. SBT349]